MQKVQGKLLEGCALCDGRGKHALQTIKLSEDVKHLIITFFCKSLPHKRSRHSRRDSDLFYFENPELNLAGLYSLVGNYFQSATGEELSLERSTFCDYFTLKVPFTFRPTRSDVRDLCFERQIQESGGSVEYEIHKNTVEEHKEQKRPLSDDETALVLEFDFGQNLPFPKLPVADHFYSRLLWLDLCNVYVHETDTSFIFYMKGVVAKKSAAFVPS